MTFVRMALVSIVVALVSSCGDRRCAMRPPPDADYGPCDLMMPHWAYIPESGICAQASGCSCDAQCQANELPFTSRQECEAVCLK